jgi:hypothetical protein
VVPWSVLMGAPLLGALAASAAFRASRRRGS